MPKGSPSFAQITALQSGQSISLHRSPLEKGNWQLWHLITTTPTALKVSSSLISIVYFFASSQESPICSNIMHSTHRHWRLSTGHILHSQLLVWPSSQNVKLQSGSGHVLAPATSKPSCKSWLLYSSSSTDCNRLCISVSLILALQFCLGQVKTVF
jgi:hypothetical protein